MNEGIALARDGIAQAEELLRRVNRQQSTPDGVDFKYLAQSVDTLAVAMKELTAAVAALDQRVNDLEYREHRRHGR